MSVAMMTIAAATTVMRVMKIVQNGGDGDDGWHSCGRCTADGDGENDDGDDDYDDGPAVAL